MALPEDAVAGTRQGFKEWGFAFIGVALAYFLGGKIGAIVALVVGIGFLIFGHNKPRALKAYAAVVLIVGIAAGALWLYRQYHRSSSVTSAAIPSNQPDQAKPSSPSTVPVPKPSSGMTTEIPATEASVKATVKRKPRSTVSVEVGKGSSPKPAPSSDLAPIDISISCHLDRMPIKIPNGDVGYVLPINEEYHKATKDWTFYEIRNVPLWPDAARIMAAGPDETNMLRCDLMNHGAASAVGIKIPIQVGYIHEPRQIALYDAAIVIGGIDHGSTFSFYAVNTCPVEATVAQPSYGIGKLVGEEVNRQFQLRLPNPYQRANFQLQGSKTNWLQIKCPDLPQTMILPEPGPKIDLGEMRGQTGRSLIYPRTRTDAGMLRSVLPPTFANSKDGAPSVEILRGASWASRPTQAKTGLEWATRPSVVGG